MQKFKHWGILTLLFAVTITVNLFAQEPNERTMNNYPKSWEAINQLEYDGLTKSALEETQKLYATIKKDNNNSAQTAQLIKALLFINKYQAKLEEDGLVKAIDRFQKEAETAVSPIKPILQSMVAEMYNNYLHQHLYKFQDRTQTEDFKQEDIRTWDVSKITAKSFELYHSSIQFSDTKTIDIKNFDAITYNASNVEGLRPTLFDFLVHRALDFFESEKYYLSQPAFKFYLDSKDYFADAQTFIAQELTAKDSLATEFQSLRLYQEATAFHLQDQDPSALVDLELRRLQYVFNKSILADKNLLYLQRLEALHTQYKEHEVAAEIAHKIAIYYNDQGNKYQPSPTDQYRWDIKKAYEICETAIKKHPKSYGASHCKALMQSIQHKDISLTVEKINPIDQPILSLLSYKNLDKIYFKAIPVTRNQYETFHEKYGKKKTAYLNRLTSTYKWSLNLKNEGDYQAHSIEFEIPKLPNGHYIIVASANSEFSYHKNGIAYSSFFVSNMSMVNRHHQGVLECFVNHRSTGQPLHGVKADFYISKYNSLLRRYETVKSHSTTSDENGFIQGLSSKNKSNNYNHSYLIKLSRKGDILFLDDSYYNYESSVPSQQQQTHFFLDRAIYRPGQTIHFKGLVLNQMSDGKNPKIVPNQKRHITFYDANGQKVTDMEVMTNEYGSYHGFFTAPLGGLLGQMYIRDNQSGSTKYFRVEEYKRPKFEVIPLPVKESFKINDLVTVKGHAKAYAGNNIDGAKVQYRVVRQAHFPYWNWRWGWYIPFNRNQQEIAFGETTTNDKGEYQIEFKAIADRSIPKDKNPEFSYTVYATVTDITGETHSSQTNVRVGYIALDVNLNVPENVDKNQFKPFTIHSQNLNGEFEAAQGQIVIEQLKTPKLVYKTRFWSKPDYEHLDEASFKKKFPAYAFKHEDEIDHWEVNKKVLTIDFDTKKSKELVLKPIKKWKQGRYRITLTTKDKYGSPIEIRKSFTIYSNKEKATPLNNALFIAQESFYNISPNTTVQLDIGSHNKAAYLLYELEYDNQIIYKKWLQPKGRTQIEVPIEEKHRGNLHFHLSSIQDGRFYSNGGTIYVPWSNKDLKIEYLTFRDKLYPGQKEEWKIKISGHKSDQVAAELLAGMYDASLDAFAANAWNFNVHPSSYRGLTLQGYNSFTQANSDLLQDGWNPYLHGWSRTYPNFNWHGFSFYEYHYLSEVVSTSSMSGGSRRFKAGRQLRAKKMAAPVSANRATEAAEEAEQSKAEASIVADFDGVADTVNKPVAPNQENDKAPEEDFGDVQVRTNLNETVFFYPDLMTDKEGNIIISFTMNEALTKWKFMLFGHTKDLATVSETKEVVTQKDLMVMPNPPRFFREKDEIFFTAKVSNLTEKDMKGQAKLQLFDAISMQPIDAQFGNTNATLPFEAKAGQSAPLAWKLNVPDGWTTAIVHRVVAKAGDFSDGEEAALPVLTNRMLVTETQPLPIRGNQTKDFTFKRMAEVTKSSSMKHHKLTLEFTQNPAWYAIQSLPYLMEYPYECTEQIFSRYYANSLASDVANSHPKVKRVFDQWKTIDTDALKSNLSKNQELKYALLEETPWVLAAQSEAVQKKNIGVLFDLNRMGNELAKARDKMADRQLANGGFSWMPGGRDSWYISQYIVEGMGHLNQLGVKDIKGDPKMANMIRRAVNYIDVELARHYQELLKWAKRSKNEKEYLERDHLNQMVIHYFYARTFFLDQKINNPTTLKAIQYYEGQALKYWRNKSMYMQGLLALGFHRKGTDLETPKKIVAAAKENALNHEELGMYWKYPSGYFWYQLPIETHALMIEVFEVVAKDAKAVEDLKVWLLKAKQTTHWKTTKATAAASYALLMTGNNWLLDDQEIEITMGGKKLDQSKIKKEAGTGYFKTSWQANEITNDMANITVKNPNNVVAWGALYWQYFEDLDKITHFKETPLKLNKKLFKQINTDRGPVLKPIEKETLEPGDLIKVRIELTVDRAMEYVHMKDMRAAGLEPTNVLSQYKYQGGLGYYESTRDASTNFFFGYLAKGTYVFEYPLRVNHKGDFSNGITTIQCMYAPEFTAHSEGIRLSIQ
ncbi:alpha-2-macroglobulin family protein [Aureispira anguillae]|uniref:MG2 domain-containing protein n=1 Tax=Aureispira anguillae TaxID=2864201 RepID=A0A915YDF0_9BACT|nr:alpha-2-macroglobulin family protein [Aureispira anguillae]BDS11025.1 MG2 domain-containing protein [Aureispira anguillae]